MKRRIAVAREDFMLPNGSHHLENGTKEGDGLQIECRWLGGSCH